MEASVSRTDKDRPYWVQKADPDNRRFRMIGNVRWGTDPDEYFWKKLWPATGCWCCSNKAWLPLKRKTRSGWKREVDMGDGC